MTRGRRGRPPTGRRASRSIRRRLGALLGTLGFLVGALLVIATLQLRATGAQTRAENRRNESFRLAESMQQSSDDLTLMVRLYVSTGDTRYRSYYDEILAIRSGTAPRPVDNDGSFWDGVLAEGKGSVEYGPPESLFDQLRDAEFTPQEFDELNTSLQASDNLAVLERDVMDRVAPRIGRGIDSTYFADVSSEYRRLVDAGYLAEKGVIMDAVGEFVALVEKRTKAALERARHANDRLTAVQIVILGLIVIVGCVAMVRTSRIVLRPFARLASATQLFARGDYERRVQPSGVSELQELVASFNTMAAAVQSDVARRERAEREATQARAAAEEANQAKSMFVAAMSHEIRTPMIGVTGMLEVLAQTELNPEQENMVATAHGSAQVLLQIIGDILDFSKIEAGKLELAPVPFMVRPLAEAAVQAFFHTASAKGVRVSCAVHDGVAVAHLGDPLRIRQILGNFVSNAVKFTASGSVVLAVRSLGDTGDAQDLEFSVADTGVGVAPEKQHELFQEFVQADAATAARSGGTGLGLVICRRLADLMEGDVRMESAPGRGTTMYLTVRLPVADQDQIGAGAGALGGAGHVRRRPKPARDVAEREGRVLLLAEDHPINQRVLVHQLGLIGFHLDVAEDGRKALDRFSNTRYGLVLTDLNMPEMDGFELARAIRQHEADAGLPRTPILALSANVLPGQAEKCVAAGMDDFVGKPASMPVLADKLARWLPDVSSAPATGPAAPAEPARPVAGAEGEVVVDRAVLDELTGGDDDLAAAILEDYLGSSCADLTALRAALDAASPDDVRRHAHRILGASRMVGARQVAVRAACLEAAASAEDADWGALRSAADDLAAAVARLAARAAPVSPAP